MSNRIIKNYKKEDIPLFKIPKSCQDVIDVVSIAKDGIFYLGKGKYSKVYSLVDINYSMFTDEDQNSILQKFCEFLNSMEVSFKFLFLNGYRDWEVYEDKYLIAQQKDSFEEIREQHNENINIVLNNKDNMVDLSKYILVIVERNTVAAARSYFSTIENNMTKQLKKISSAVHPLNAEERLKLLFRWYNPACAITPEIRYDDLVKNLKDFKDLICPGMIQFCDGEKVKNPHINLDKRVMKAFYIRDFSSHISDEMIKGMLDLGYEMIISEDVVPIPKDKAVNYCNQIYMNIENKISKIQEKHNKNNAFSSDIPFLIRKEKDDMEDILRKLNKNQNLFYVCFTILLCAKDEEQLEQAETALQTYVSGKTMQMEVYRMRQREAFNTCLPIGVRQVSAMRLFLSNSLVALFPFDAFNIMDESGCFMGYNAITKELILVDRKKLVNGHGVILGTSGAGKSMFTKDNIEECFFRYPNDKIIIIDPQGEYREVAKTLNGVYIDISNKSQTYINPFAISDFEFGMTAEELAREKADLALAICENGCNSGFTNKHKSIVSRCLKQMYSECMDSSNHILRQPLLEDFNSVLIQQPEKEASDISLSMELYITGILNVFNHPSNVDTYDNRLVIFGLSRYELELKENGVWTIQYGKSILFFNVPDSVVKDFIHNEIIGKVITGYRLLPVFDISSVTTQVEQLFIARSACQSSEMILDADGEPVTNKKGQVLIRNSEERKNRLQLQYGVDLDDEKAVHTEYTEEQLNVLLTALEKVSLDNGVPVEYTDIQSQKPGCLGYYSRKNNAISLEETLGVKQKVSVLLHEMAHSELHYDITVAQQKQSELEGTSIKLTREMREIQAESVAYMVAGCYGLKTDTKSFKYLANYSKNGVDDFMKSMNVTWKERNNLVDKIEVKLAELGYTRELQKLEQEKTKMKEESSILPNSLEDAVPVSRGVAEKLCKKIPVFRKRIQKYISLSPKELNVVEEMLYVQKEELKKLQENGDDVFPLIKCEWSESTAFEDGMYYTISEFNNITGIESQKKTEKRARILKQYGSEQAVMKSGNLKDMYDCVGYEKTKIEIHNSQPNACVHEERLDIGDFEGNLFDYLKGYHQEKIASKLEQAMKLEQVTDSKEKGTSLKATERKGVKKR